MTDSDDHPALRRPAREATPAGSNLPSPPRTWEEWTKRGRKVEEWHNLPEPEKWLDLPESQREDNLARGYWYIGNIRHGRKHPEPCSPPVGRWGQGELRYAQAFKNLGQPEPEPVSFRTPEHHVTGLNEGDWFNDFVCRHDWLIPVIWIGGLIALGAFVNNVLGLRELQSWLGFR
jgi:hypothetical protein